MKVAVNKCFGGFELSLVALKLFCEKKGIGFYPYKQTKYRFQDGVEEYTYIANFDNDDMFFYVSTIYLGDKCESLDNDHCWYYGNIDRTDKDLIEVIEVLGCKANGRYSNIEIIEIPDDINWQIDDYDGIETIHEVHRSW